VKEFRLTMARLGLAAAERGDATGAAEALRGVIGMLDREDEPALPPELRAVRKKKLAQLLDCSTRHIDSLEKKFVPGAVLGEGSGKRYVVSLVFASLGKKAPPVQRSPMAAEVDDYFARRSSLKKINGGRS
jgi:hypothetical protein